MRVGIVSNNYLNKQNNGTTFQGGYTKGARIRDAVLVAQGQERFSNPRRLGKIIKTLVQMLEGDPDVVKAKIDLNSSEIIRNTTRVLGLKASTEEKKTAIDVLFNRMQEETDLGLATISDYIDGTLVPHIVKTEDYESAKYILSITDRRPDERTSDSIKKRIGLLKELGSEANIHELETYTRNSDRTGLPDNLKTNEGLALDIEMEANAALVKLRTSPNFKADIAAWVPD